MNVIDLETPKNTEKHVAPQTENDYPFYITEYGKTFSHTPCYQLRLNSPVSCIQYVISGSGVILSDDQLFTVEAGDTFLLLEGNNQIYYSNPDNQFERIWINFKGPLSEALISIYGLKGTVVFKHTNSLLQLEELHKICHNNPDSEIYKRQIAPPFLTLIQYLADNRENSTEASRSAEEMRAYLDMHILENLQLKDIAFHFSFTKEHFIRVFRKNYGITPHQYVLQSRIRIAMIMLASTGDPIREISEKLCFSDPHHFSDTFQKYVGQRPSQYRKTVRQNSIASGNTNIKKISEKSLQSNF